MSKINRAYNIFKTFHCPATTVKTNNLCFYDQRDIFGNCRKFSKKRQELIQKRNITAFSYPSKVNNLKCRILRFLSVEQFQRETELGLFELLPREGYQK